eukprot:scaffold82496_cov29-Tisochrysis_lutea.AAC.10
METALSTFPISPTIRKASLVLLSTEAKERFAASASVAVYAPPPVPTAEQLTGGNVEVGTVWTANATGGEVAGGQPACPSESDRAGGGKRACAASRSAPRSGRRTVKRKALRCGGTNLRHQARAQQPDRERPSSRRVRPRAARAPRAGGTRQ